MKKRVIIFSPYPKLGASVRYRILQFLDSCKDKGYIFDFHPFMGDLLYKRRRTFGFFNQIIKLFLIKLSFIRFFLRLLTIKKYDICIIHREILPIGPVFVEKLIHSLGIKIVFDFDDAIYAQPTSGVNQRFLFDPNKTDNSIALSNHVIAGNNLLADKAKTIIDKSKVSIIPTVVDTSLYPTKKVDFTKNKKVTLGWIGNWGNAIYLDTIKQAIESLDSNTFELMLIGGKDIWDINFNCNIIRVPWSIDDEIEQMSKFDIGIMPLLSSDYDKGKCGFKIIQYYALGIPAIASPIGANKTIIKHGESGYLANTQDEWLKSLKNLIDSPQKRYDMGICAKKIVEESYSLKSQIPAFCKVLNNL